ncbi:MAG: hypothetical protein M5U28_28760 [Sandaracinaceae bacterium]|nr:hypothetical protein [Sandaracinaceae bacterium]
MDAGRDAGPPGDAGPPEIPDEPLEDWDEEGAGPLTGIFAVEVIIPARAVVDLESRQLYRLRILQRDDQVRMRISPCRFALPRSRRWPRSPSRRASRRCCAPSPSRTTAPSSRRRTPSAPPSRRRAPSWCSART